MRHSRLRDWLGWLDAGAAGRIDLGLDRVSRVADRLRVIRLPCTVIKVAGTNGKGSSVAMLDAVLRRGGYRVGAYTSPVLDHFEECLVIDGRPVDEAPWLEALDTVDRARGGAHLTGFEFQTIAAAWLLARAAVDVALMEIGLGGSRDAVNALAADASLITAIDVDHTDWLGPTRESVAREKAGVLAAGVPAVCADPRPPRAVLEAAERLDVSLALRGRDFEVERERGGWRWSSEGRSLGPIGLPGLRGEHQLDNAAGVVALLDALRGTLPVDDAVIEDGIVKATLAGRQQLLGDLPWRLVDVAHNVHSALALARTLAESPTAGATHLVLGVLRDKDAAGIVAAVSPLVDAWYLVDIEGARGAPAARLHDALSASGARGPRTEHRSPGPAWREAVRRAGKADRVVACGSFAVARDVLRVESSRG